MQPEQPQYSQFFASMGHQLEKLWEETAIPQKIALIATICILAGLLIFSVFNATGPNYVLLYPKDQMLPADADEVMAFLDTHQINYRIDGSTGILVPAEAASKVRMELAAGGLPKHHSNKGFDLFDSNTWIEGDKELQIMQMRAIEGQLEQDICQYDNIQSANVALDTTSSRPTSRYDNSEANKIKASVILGLKPGAHLTENQIRAITFHISGAVRGLEPDKIAISDTSGKLYQAMDTGNAYDQEIALEDRLKSKIDEMLAVVVGAGNFYSTVQVVMNHQGTENSKTNPTSEQIKNITISVLINKTSGPESLKREIENQLTKILEDYNVTTKTEVNFIPFEHNHAVAYNPEESYFPSAENVASALLALIFVAAGMVWAFNRFWKQQESPAEFAEEEVSDQFMFSDIALLDDASIKALVEEVDLSDLSLAMKGTPHSLKERILSNLSKEQAQQLHTLLSQKRLIKPATVHEARERIVACVHQLDSQGRIIILPKDKCSMVNIQ